MNVLHVYKSYYPESVGGVEQVIHQLAEGCRNYGVESSVVTLSDSLKPSSTYMSHHKVMTIPRTFEIASTGFSLKAIGCFSEMAKAADIVHYHFPWPFMDIMHFFGRVTKPTVVTYHSDIVRQKLLLKVYTPVMHAFLQRVSRIVATSPNYVETSHVLQKFKDKVEVIPLGLDEASYPAATMERISYWQQRVGSRFFIFVGVLRYYKGLDVLLDALAINDLPVVIVGSGPLEQSLRSRAADLKLKNIQFVGRVSDEDKVALVQLSMGMVFPSHQRSEAFGLSLLEGAMFAKPMISCEIGTATSFVNEHGVTGYVVDPSDPRALSGAMTRLWANPARAEEMGAQARERYLRFFTADKMAQKYADLYKRLLKKHD